MLRQRQWNLNMFQSLNFEVIDMAWISTDITSPANIYLFKDNNRNTTKRCEICSKLTLKTPEWFWWRRSGVFIVNFKHISQLFLVFLLLILNK